MSVKKIETPVNRSERLTGVFCCSQMRIIFCPTEYILVNEMEDRVRGIKKTKHSHE